MQYKENTAFSHDQADKVGVLICNLGTPEAPEPPALREYLNEFLSDPRVIEVPRLLWWCILHGIILRTRPAKSAEAYKSVWTEKGSPLLIFTQQQAKLLRKRLASDDVLVDFAMRYGKPSISEKVDELLRCGARKLFVLPLYPQYCAATSGSTFDALAKDFQHRRWLPELRFLNSYHDHPLYIKALADSVREHWRTHARAEKLVYSYHGIPLRYLHNGDPYHCQCHKTSRLLAEELGLEDDQFLTTFQSRFGKEEWLKPYTDATMKSLPAQGIKSVQVLCPGFAADCLETIEEIGEENREYFIEAGGERFEYIPALNANNAHLDLLESIIHSQIESWLPVAQDDLARRARLAEQHPFNQNPN